MFNFEYVGNIHVHSAHSDGGGSVAEIADAANRVGLDFVSINDHAYMTDDLHLEKEGFYGKTLVLMNLEIGVRYHHYLAFGLKEMVRQHNLGPQEVIDRVNEQGAFGFISHPFEKGMPFSENSIAYTWNDLSVTGFTGIGIWNYSSRWKERVRSALHGMYFLTYKTQTLLGPSKETLSFWDGLCQERRVVGVGESDAHANPFTWRGVRIMPHTYDHLLNTINLHVLLYKRLSKVPEEAKLEIYEAMKQGRLFIAHDALCPARGFKFDFLSDDGSDMFMGEEGRFHPGELVVESPHDGEIRLIRDGGLVKKWKGREAVFRVTEKGVYRVEVYRPLHVFGWRPWIFSNPIYLR